MQIDENVAREIINHRSLRHPNIIRFKEASIFFLLLLLLFSPLNQLKKNLTRKLSRIILIIIRMEIKQVVLTPTHLAIVMEYAAGGELFDRICNAGRFSEDEVLLPLFPPLSLFYYYNIFQLFFSSICFYLKKIYKTLSCILLRN